MLTKTLNQRYFFKATPNEVYDLLMDAKKHTAFTGALAEIENKVGGKFIAWDHYIQGQNLVLEEGLKIVQKWRAEEDGWPDDYFSEATFVFKEKDDGCELTFTQTGIPQECFKNIEQGWIDYYWKPMEDYLDI